jgi:L-amino acid N-acyltransferase YncA
MSSIKIYKAKSIKDYIFLREVRNQNREFLTENINYITTFDQIFFYLFQSRRYRIYIVEKKGQKAGYILLKQSKNIYFITEIILKKFRRQNLGTQMVNFAKKKYKNLIAKIALKNKASISFHKKNGFKVIKRDKKMLYLYL